MATTTVRRAGNGTDRLFVSGVDGRRLGWHDLVSGATHLEDSGAGALVGDAVARYVASRSPLRRRGVGVLVGPRSAVTLPNVAGRPVRTAARPSGREGMQQEDLRERVAGETTARALLQALPATVPAPGRWARLVGRDPLAPVNRAHHQQVLAERRVGRALAGLGRRWQSLHCVPVASDQTAHHLLVGAGGVVLLRTCAHPGEVVSVVGGSVSAAGLPTHALQAALTQAAVVAEQLARHRGARVHVHALVVVAGARRLVVVDGPPRGSTVLQEADLARWLADRPVVLSSLEVERLTAAAARTDTWSGATADAGPGARERRGRRRQERLRLDEWSTAVAAAARARLVGRLAVLGSACLAAPVLVALVGGA